MKNNSYVAAIENIHAPQYAVDNAIAAAKARAAKRLSAQMNMRYAAVAAGVVIAAGGAVYLTSNGGFEPPVKLPYTPAATSSVQTATESLASTTVQATTLQETLKPTQPSQTDAVDETVVSETIVSETPAQEAPSQSVAETTAVISQSETEQPADLPTEPDIPDETEPEYVEVTPIDVEVDRSQLGSDGKLYCMIAETGYNIADDPTAFSDDHVYYVETKFGRYKQTFEPLRIEHKDMGHMNYIYYNSDGVVLYTEPLRWDLG